MNVLKLIPALVLTSLYFPVSGQAQVTMTEFTNGLYDTGLGNATAGNNATTLTGGSSDTHYVIASAPAGSTITSGSSVVVRNSSLPAGWVANATGSTPPARWDGTSATAAVQPTGTYDYKLTLTSITANSLVTISGNIAADNQVSILANGTIKVTLTTNPTYAGSFTPFSFSFTSPLSGTTDTLDFDVLNTGTGASTTGLQVQGLVGTYTPVPEPRDTTLFFLLGVGVIFAVRKLRQRFGSV